MIALFANRWLVAVPPIWLVAVGGLITVIILLAIWAALAIVWPRAAAEARASLRDGFAGPVAWLLLTMAAVAVAARNHTHHMPSHGNHRKPTPNTENHKRKTKPLA